MLIIILQNFLYAIVGTFIGIIACRIAVKFLDLATPYDTQKELEQGNRAVGNVVAAIYIGTSILVGLIIGLGLN